MNSRALLLTAVALLLAVPARAELEGDRVRLTGTVGHITFDAQEPWNSIDPTVLYGGSLGVKVNRWFGINSSIGWAFANGNFGWVEDGMGGFTRTDNSGKDVDVLHFGVDLSFHPLQGRIDPWVMAGWTLMSYDFKFDSTAFGDWLSENDAEWNLNDLRSATGWQFGIGCAVALLNTEHTSWSIMADFRDLLVKSNKLEIVDSSGEKILEGKWGHNLLFNLGIEFSWGNYPAPTDEPNSPAYTGD